MWVSTVLTWGDDTNTPRDGLGSNRVITSDHNDLDTSGPTLFNSAWDSGPRRVNHRNQTNKGQVVHREVFSLSVELVAVRVLSFVQGKRTETEDTFSKASEGLVGGLELLLPLVVELFFFAVDEDLERGCGRGRHSISGEEKTRICVLLVIPGYDVDSFSAPDH